MKWIKINKNTEKKQKNKLNIKQLLNEVETNSSIAALGNAIISDHNSDRPQPHLLHRDLLSSAHTRSHPATEQQQAHLTLSSQVRGKNCFQNYNKIKLLVADFIFVITFRFSVVFLFIHFVL